jgi:hypothetical protein
MYSLLFAVLPVCAHTFPFACVATCRTVCSYASSAPMRGGATLTCAYRSGLVEPCGLCVRVSAQEVTLRFALLLQNILNCLTKHSSAVIKLQACILPILDIRLSCLAHDPKACLWTVCY